MKKKDLTSLRKKDIAELKKEADDKKKEAAGVYAQMHAGQEDNLKKFSSLRRDIAQLFTIIREKELIEEHKSDSNNKKEAEKAQ